MAALALITIGLAVALTAFAMITAHRRESPKQLRGDWWSEFEREFRAYAERTTRR